MINITIHNYFFCNFILGRHLFKILITNTLKFLILILTFRMESEKKIKKEEWIKEDLKSKIPKLDKKIIFVPSKNELNFKFNPSFHRP